MIIAFSDLLKTLRHAIMNKMIEISTPFLVFYIWIHAPPTHVVTSFYKIIAMSMREIYVFSLTTHQETFLLAPTPI